MKISLLFGVALVLSQAGCAMKNYGVKVAVERFTQSLSCPAGKVVSHQTPLGAADFGGRAPPPDVARDPERLAVWSANDSAKLGNYHDITAVDAAGCGGRQVYLCWRENYRTLGEWTWECQPVDLKSETAALEAIPITAAARASIPGRLASAPEVKP